MKKILHLAVALLFTNMLHAQTTDSCQSETFLRTFGTSSTLEVGLTLCPSGDGNIYASGVQGSETVLQKITPTGSVLWSRSFAFASHLPCLINEMIVDSDGKLVVAGLETGTNLQQLNPSSLVFRYDPVADSTLWIKRFSGDSIPTNGIIEKKPGGNFIFYQNTISAATFIARAEVLELDRATGKIVPGVAQLISINNVAEITRLVSYGGSLYAVGTAQVLPYPVLRLRTVLLRFDTINGKITWSKFSSISGFSATNTIGLDLLVDNDTLVSLSTAANLVGSALGPGQIYLQKNTLDGNLVWLKKYDFPAFSGEIGIEVVKIGSHYAVYGTGTLEGKSAQLLLLVDHDGNVIQAKQLANTNESTVLPLSKGEAVAFGNHLVFAGTIGDLTNTDWSLLKTDSILDLKDECSNLQFTPFVTVATVTGPLNYNATVRNFTIPTVFSSVAAPVITNISLESHLLCPVCNAIIGTPDVGDRGQQPKDQYLHLYPNPTSGQLLFDLTAWDNQTVQIQVLNAQGKIVQTLKTVATAGLQSIVLNGQLPAGLYQLVIRPNEGAPVAKPFILER